nr:DUF3320 domain-containing protein [uncultured Chryseobacterium sp.]
MNQNIPFEVQVEHTPYINYTFVLNRYNFLQQISFSEVSEDLENLNLQISSSLGIFETYNIYIDQLKKDSLYKITLFNFVFDNALLKSLSEKDIDTITVEVLQNKETVFRKNFSVEVLPVDYFGGLQTLPQLLASYVIPNHTLIYKIKSDAIKLLEQKDMNPSFEGYQANDRKRVLEMVSAIYKAIQNLELIYSSMPPGFEENGQRIRLLDQVAETKFGNCIDISLLFIACLEAISLNPILVITKGHAFPGVWLDDERFDAMVNFDRSAISKRIASGIRDIALIESANLCKGSNLRFRQAMESAETQIMDADNFILSIDIKNARSNGISPLPLLKTESVSGEDPEVKSSTDSNDWDHDFDMGTLYSDLDLTDTSQLTKQKVWERKLLDLSLRNNLLNLRFTKSMLQLVDYKVNLLEDSLAEGKAFTIHPNSNQPVLRKYNLYHEPLHPSQPLFQLADDEFKYNKILTYYHQDDLDTILTNLYRNSKLAEEENGKSTLYLSIGLLKWYEPKNKEVPRFAPILLIPVELSRRSVNSKFMLRSREEETMINITLLEYLKQEFKLNLNSLETLPTDEFGLDVSKVMAIIRNAVMNLEGWDVLEQMVLGTFSFNKLILWQDLSKYAEEIQKSPIVKSLIDGKLSETPDQVNLDAESLENMSASELMLPISTDNSQLNAVKNAHQNKTFILHGPPGTGKSQTITNIIADALANDKKVLFVAAKKAALDVVHSRLENIGLGAFCLELHSNKSKKSDVLKQFERTLESSRFQTNKNFGEEAKRLDDRKLELGKYINQLHRKFKIGWSLFDTISYLETHQVKADDRLMTDAELENTEVSTWNRWKDWLIPFASIVQKTGQPADHPLHPITIASHQYENKNVILNAVHAYIEKENSASQVKENLQLQNSDDQALTDLLDFLYSNSLKAHLVEICFNETQSNLFKNWLTQQDLLQKIESQISHQFHSGIFDPAAQSLHTKWSQAKHTWFIPKWLKKRKVKQQLNGYSKSKIDSDTQVDELFARLEEHKQIKNQLSNKNFDTVINASTPYFKGNLYDIPEIEKDFNTLQIAKDLGHKTGTQNFQIWLKTFLHQHEIQQQIPEFISEIKAFQESRIHLLKYIDEIPQRGELEKIIEHIDKLDHWVNYNVLKDEAEDLGLTWFIQFLEQKLLDTDIIETEFEKIVHLNLFIKTIYKFQTLNSFDADVYESQIQQYRNLHKEFTLLTKDQLIVKLSGKIPNFVQEAAQSSEIGILQKAIRNKGRGLSIRKLFDLIPGLIPRLKPCMLMSPISVAQYFDVNQEHFDIVIFDEASQLPTSEAISALARAGQAIIVGDPKQMPPTSFFSSSKTDEDNMELEDLESILDDCLALSIPSNYLLRHYRSKHESLISFSNAHFYDNKLLTFPSPDDLNRKVTFEYVDGFYDKGKTRTNVNEAQAIIGYIKDHFLTKNKKSIGVVTFSQTQQNLIEDLLQKLFLENPALEEFSLNSAEPIFIKNLENVQGDERDVILFSVGYGPDEEGKVSMNFGPLNRDGGWRRLNVAVTRARYEMKVFSSLTGDQIDLNRTNAEGVKGLKNFLHFSEKGLVLQNTAVQSRDEKSIVNAIARLLENHGLEVKTNIGTSDYKIDIGIIDPENKNEYLLAILVDSENYFNISTTNDRELLAPNVLKGLGWNIFRIWTLDWIKNKENIIIEIKTLLEKIKNEEKSKEEENKQVEQSQQNSLSEIIHEEARPSGQPYRAAEISPVPDANSDTVYAPENKSLIRSQIIEIIDTEAPISQPMLFRKILKLWNTLRTGAKLSSYLDEIIQSVPNLTVTETYQKFYWSETVRPENLYTYRNNDLEKRNIEDIAAEEISVAIMEIMSSNLSVSKNELIRVTSRLFGFMKVGTQIDSVVQYAINELIRKDLLTENEGRIVLV